MKQRPETKADIVVDHAVRWATNILIEVNVNYASKINPEAAKHLRNAVNSLQEIYSLIGR